MEIVVPPPSQHISRWGLLYAPHPLNMLPGGDCCIPPNLSTCFQVGIVVSPPPSQHVSRWGLLYPPPSQHVSRWGWLFPPHAFNMFPGGDCGIPPPSQHVSRWEFWYPPLSTCFQVGIVVSPPLNMLPGGDCGIPPPLSQHVYSLKGL